MANKKQPQNTATMEGAFEVSFFDKYKKSILYVTGGVIAVVAIVIALKFGYFDPRSQKADEAIYQAQAYFEQGDYEKALKGDGKTCEGFLSVASSYSGTKAGNLAKLYAGLSYAQTGDYKNAITYLEDYSTRDDEMVSPAALGTLGNCYANVGNTDKAVETLLKAAHKADNNSLSPTFLIEAGEIYESQGNKAKAKECYEEVKTKYVNSMAYQTIDKYLERVSE
jgi:tetratricopeptide (TPR) repeat protein